MLKVNSSKKAALVLSGGGALGAAHIGVWQKLEKNYNFDFLVGTSAGAIVAALIAVGKSSSEAEKIVLETNILKYLFDLSVSGIGIIKGNKIEKLFHEFFGDLEFKDLKTNLYIGTTNFENGKKIIINKGKIKDALRSSVSIPVLFEPFFHPIYKAYLVDGGLSQNFPLDTAITKYKGEKIFGSDVAGSFSSKISFKEPNILEKPKYLRDLMQRSFRIIFKNQQSSFPKDERVKIIRPKLENFTSMDINKLEQIISAGRNSIL